MKSDTVIAFDYGTKNIGVAVAQRQLGAASPLRLLKARDGIPDWKEIETLLKEWKPQTLVVGLPLNMDDSDNETTKRARKFANRLEGRFNIKTELIDERLSTREAKNIAHEQKIFSGNFSGDYKNNPVDLIAACLILETYLNT